MNSSPCFGYRPDTPDARDYTLSNLLAATPDKVLPAPDHTAFRVSRLEQGRAGACFSFAKARAINITQRIASGTSPEYISVRYDYVVGRRQEDAGKMPEALPRLVDSGQMPRYSMNGSRSMGIVPWSACPYPTQTTDVVYVDPDTGTEKLVSLYNSEDMDRFVNASLPLSAIHQAYDQRGLSFYRLTPGNGLAGEIRAALFRGYGVILGMHVDEAVVQHRGSAPIASIDLENVVGGHAVEVLKIEDDGTTLNDNWWGKDWGFDDGMFRLSPRVLTSDAIIDVYAVKSAPAWEAEHS